MARNVALLLGGSKAAASRAMAQYADDVEFVRVKVPAKRIGPQLVQAADEVVARRPVTAVVATSESFMLSAGFLRSRYGLPGLNYEESLVVTNKWRMRAAVADAVKSPCARLSGRFLDEDGAPEDVVVIKPLQSSSARGVQKMNRRDAVAWLRGDAGLWLVEDAVSAQREFHCDGVLANGQIAWLEASRYSSPVLSAHGTWATEILRPEDPARADLETASGRVLAALAVRDAVFHIEFLDDGSSLMFGEIGLRPAGAGVGDLHMRASGADLWGAFVASQLGRPIDGFGPQRDVVHSSGLIFARPEKGRSPLPPSEALTLPGVAALGPGNIQPGTEPTDLSHFDYLVFFEGVAGDEVSDLREKIARRGSQ